MSTFSPTILLVCFCLLLGTEGLNAQYRIDQWTAEDGLPQNSVYGIVQTADGYLWMATVDGLARFDGVRFKVFNKSSSPGIVNNRFVSLFEDASRNLWAGTEESGLVRFSGGMFESFRTDAGAPQSAYWIEESSSGSGAIFWGPNGWIQFKAGEFSPLDTLPNPPTASTRSTNVRLLCRLNSENRYSECFVNGQWLSFSIADASSPQEFVSVASDVSAAQQADGTVWLIMADGRVARAEHGRVTRIFDEHDGLPKYPLCLIDGARLVLLAKDADDSLWLIDLPSMKRELLIKKEKGAFPREKGEFISTYADGEGNLWFGTMHNGLFRARSQIVTAYSEADGIADKNVYPIYQDRAGTTWIGTTSGLFKHENSVFSLIDSTKGFAVNAIAEDALGRLVISSPNELYVRDNSKFVLYERPKIGSVGPINALYLDGENALWIGNGSVGLQRFKNGELTGFSLADGLAGNDVKTIIGARAGGIWIGTYDGLTRFENGRLTSWREPDGLPSRTVRALYEDVDGTLWIGSYDGGLARFKDGKFTSYSVRNGLPNDGAFQILEDDNRNLWVSSNRGIYRVNKDELNEFAEGRVPLIHSVSYGKADGMLNPECNGGRSPAGIRARDGRMWFPTQDGVAVIDPDNIDINLQGPPVVIETVKVDNELLDLAVPTEESGDLALPAASPTPLGAARITLQPSQQNFEISYTALSFINSEQLRFKYKLEGLDEGWVEAGTRRLAHFSHVPPGSYTFRVIAANSDNIWNEHAAVLKIVVLSPFYRNWWFLILASCVIAAAAFLMFKRRLQQIGLKHAAELAFSRRLIDSQEQERKRFAAEMHDGLGQSLVIIKNRARLSLRQSDQSETALDHLESISETASHAIHEAKEIAFNLRPHLLDRLGLTKTIGSMLVTVFGASGIECTSEVDLIDGVLEKDSEIMLYRIIQECASNIVKHSQAENAFLRIEHNERALTIKIIDDGRGFDRSVPEHDLSKRSFGLVGIAERTRLLGGKLNIESELGKGTIVSIIINLPT